MVGRKRCRDTGKGISEEQEVAVLDRRAAAEAPPPGTQLFTVVYSTRDSRRFDELPLSRRTCIGLEEGGFKTMTEIQVAALPHALAGRDILGAARTGSGKTLAFLIPLLEELFRRRWTFTDGLGALVVSPTRELALQIFEVLRVVGKQHAMSAGLITGGKKEFREEQQRIVRMNILVATPGRLLQHLEQTPGFDVSQLQVLVLDEADRILDLGFREQLNGVLSYLPSERQTLLFSATQTKSVKDLARLSLNRVATEYVAVRHGAEDSATPTKLVQNYVVCALPDKLDVLFSFLKTHLKSKVVVFFNSCAQASELTDSRGKRRVRFVHALLCELQPGMPLLALHGKCKQGRRTE
ncbi:unnamed protein product, partial [Phaeothamnion confervicola]